MTDKPASRELDPMFIKLVNYLLQQFHADEIKTLDHFIQQSSAWLLAQSSSWEECESCLKGDVYKNYRAARFMLCKLEETNQTNENKPDLWEYNGHYTLTLEHILPQSSRLGPEWMEMLERNQTATAAEIHKRCVDKLGNLTLSGYNSNLGAMPFLKKRDRFNENGRPIGYRNGFYLNTDLANRDEWNEVAINERTNKMAGEVKKYWECGKIHDAYRIEPRSCTLAGNDDQDLSSMQEEHSNLDLFCIDQVCWRGVSAQNARTTLCFFDLVRGRPR